MAHAGEADPSANLLQDFARETVRGTAGFIRAAQDGAGRWWLIDPHDRPFFCRGVHDVRAAGSEAAIDPAARLRCWGFNAVGVGGDGSGSDDGLAFLRPVDFCRVGAVIAAPGVRLPDVFDPDWPRLAAEHAVGRCGPLVMCRELLGWLADDAPLWGRPGAMARPTLLQVCLSLEPSFAAYHAAWEFALALHGGRLESLARAWGGPLANKEVVREQTRAEQGLATRGYLRDDARWTREFARRYFSTTSAAIRAADPNHLLFGCRFNGTVDESVRAGCVFPAVDVPLLDASDLPAGSLGAGPVLVDGVCWAEEFSLEPTAAAEPSMQSSPRAARRLTSVERMLRRGRGLLARVARHPAAVGYVWRQWLDEPGEQPPFAGGLVHLNGAEAREHTELLADFNARAEIIRRSTATIVFS